METKMDDKKLGEQLAYDLFVIVENHHFVNQEIWDRVYDVHGGKKDTISAIDKRAVLEGAVAEFRKTFAEELDRAFDYNLENLD